MTDVAPETDVEAEVATAERMVRSFRGQPQNLDQLACNEVASLIARLRSLLLRAEEFYKAHEAVERGIIDFDLHAAAVERLRAAQAAMQAALATQEETKEAR